MILPNQEVVMGIEYPNDGPIVDDLAEDEYWAVEQAECCNMSMGMDLVHANQAVAKTAVIVPLPIALLSALGRVHPEVEEALLYALREAYQHSQIYDTSELLQSIASTHPVAGPTARVAMDVPQDLLAWCQSLDEDLAGTMSRVVSAHLQHWGYWDGESEHPHE